MTSGAMSSSNQESNHMSLIKGMLSDEYADIEVLKYEHNYSVRPNRYAAVVTSMVEVPYTVDLGNCSQEDINELTVYLHHNFVESSARQLFAKGADLGKAIRLSKLEDREAYIATLIKEWNKARNANKTLAKVEAKRPKAESKYKRVTVKVLAECKALREQGKSWSDITTTLREYDPVQLKTKGMAFIAKSSL